MCIRENFKLVFIIKKKINEIKETTEFQRRYTKSLVGIGYSIGIGGSYDRVFACADSRAKSLENLSKNANLKSRADF